MDIYAEVTSRIMQQMWCDREIEIKALFIPVGILWFIYNFIYFSWIGLICQALAVSFNVFFVARYCLRNKKNVTVM